MDPIISLIHLGNQNLKHALSCLKQHSAIYNELDEISGQLDKLEGKVEGHKKQHDYRLQRLKG